MATNYLIGDTIRFKVTFKDYNGNESDPASKTISVYREDGVTALLEDAAITSKVAGSTAQYTYDWQISTSLKAFEKLIAVVSWTGNHKTRLRVNATPIQTFGVS